MNTSRPLHHSTPPAIFSFFAGIGFLDLGFEKSGYEVVYVNEIHEPFQKAYSYARNQMGLTDPIYGYALKDFEELLSLEQKKLLLDLIQEARQRTSLVGFVGGPPCPDFSVGGKNRGQQGENGKLSAAYIELICQLQPDFFLFENVKGLWQTHKHRCFYETLKTSVQDAGYIITDKLINSIEYGVPQDRDRIILIGLHRRLFNSGDHVVRLIPTNLFPWKDFTAYSRDIMDVITWPKTDLFNIDSVLECPPNIPKDLTVENWFQGNQVSFHENSSHHFQPRAGLARFMSVQEGDDSKKSFKRLHRWRYSPTACYGNNEVHLHPYKARRISAAEALALQSLPASFVLPGTMSLTNMFKSIGNGVPYLMSSAIARMLLSVLDESYLSQILELSMHEYLIPRAEQLELSLV